MFSAKERVWFRLKIHLHWAIANVKTKATLWTANFRMGSQSDLAMSLPFELSLKAYSHQKQSWSESGKDQMKPKTKKNQWRIDKHHQRKFSLSLPLSLFENSILLIFLMWSPIEMVTIAHLVNHNVLFKYPFHKLFTSQLAPHALWQNVEFVIHII